MHKIQATCIGLEYRFNLEVPHNFGFIQLTSLNDKRFPPKSFPKVFPLRANDSTSLLSTTLQCKKPSGRPDASKCFLDIFCSFDYQI